VHIRDGQQLIDQLTAEGVAVTAAAWVKESDGGLWYLYLVTPLVSEEGDTLPAYRRVNAVIREMQKEDLWIDPFDKKVIGPHDPIARDIMAHRSRRARTLTWFGGSRLGELAVEEACIYPPSSDLLEAGVSKG
jgi:hypothetical protein